MSASSVAISSRPENIDVNDPSLDFLQTAPGPNSPYSSKLWDSGYIEKALSHDDCCNKVRKNTHEVFDHVCKQTMTCHQRFCDKVCAFRIAQIRYSETINSPTFRELMHCPGQPDKLMYIEVLHPCAEEHGAIRALNNSIGPALRKLSGVDYCPSLWNAPAWIKGNLIIRILYWGDYVNPARFKAAWPLAQVTAVERPRLHVHRILQRVLEPLLPKDDAERARLEVLFDRTQQFHAIDVHREREENPIEEELFPQETSNTVHGNNSEKEEVSAAPAPKVKPKKLCPCCGKVLKAWSDWLPKNATAADWAKVHWNST